jgi:7,8-dihydropterin-6-yl-methyl-4-(beta-D-ribofuranosyl)aminobenzene 5'-phosphate synthase
MRITTLIENLVYRKDLLAEHGLSLYLETDKKKILFDTGQSGHFIHNADVLGIDLTAVDAVVISHGHYDHTGGLYTFLEMNSKALVYIKKDAFEQKYHGTDKFIGVKYNPMLDKRIVYVESPIELDEGIFIMPDIQIVNPIDTHFNHFTIKTPAGFIDDTFNDELFLAIRRNNELSVLSSCSHRGITNIAHTAMNHFNIPVVRIIGGFHIRNCTFGQLETITSYLKSISIKSIGVCHCTGVEQYAELLLHFKTSVFYNHTGYSMVIS